MEPTFFATPAELRAWFEQHADSATVLLVGFYRRDSGRPSITWPQSVDQALCFGWIDGIRKRIDDQRYTIRFTPRKRGSNWSTVNIKRVGELSAQGLMRPAGLTAFELRKENRSSIYSYENRPRELEEPYASRFRANARAWEFFHSQAVSYRRTAMWWIVSAKKEETRLRRLDTLIQQCERHEPFGRLNPPRPSA